MQRKGRSKEIVSELVEKRKILQIEMDQEAEEKEAKNERARDILRREFTASRIEKVRQWKALNHPDASSDDETILAYMEQVRQISTVHVNLRENQC